VNYNMDQPVRGDGSCVFLHEWSAPAKGTAGCTAMSPKDIEDLVRWVNGEGRAVLLQLPKPDLVHGAHWSAGEIGYMLVPELPRQPLTVNGLGVLEGAIGGEGIKRAWLNCANVRGSGMQKLRPTEIFDLAADGDACAERVLRLTAEHLASAIVNLSLVLDTPLVVLGGGIGSHLALVEATRKAIARNEFACPEVVASSLGRDAQLHGAIWLAIHAAEQHGFRRRSETSKRLRLAKKA